MVPIEWIQAIKGTNFTTFLKNYNFIQNKKELKKKGKEKRPTF